MWAHVYRLADMLASTKECIEDVFGTGVDLQRSNKNPWKVGTVEKLHHLQSYWVRLDRHEWGKMRCSANDFSETMGAPIRKHVNVGSYAPQSNVSSSFRLACMKSNKGLGQGAFLRPKYYISMFKII